MTERERLATLLEQLWFGEVNDAPDLWGTFADRLIAAGVRLSPDASRTDSSAALREAASRYRTAEWAARIYTDDDRLAPEHNARVEKWRTADAALAALLGETSPFSAALPEAVARKYSALSQNGEPSREEREP